MLHNTFRGCLHTFIYKLMHSCYIYQSQKHYFIYALVKGSLVKPGVVSVCPFYYIKREEMQKNKLTFLNSKSAKYTWHQAARETHKYKQEQPFLLAPSAAQTQSNPDLAPLGGQRVYKKGLKTGNTVASNRLWNPAVTMTALLSRQQQYPKGTADQQGKWITMWDGAIFPVL